jgi:hypothetical protein
MIERYPSMVYLDSNCSPADINKFIQKSKVNTDLISDGYHTFGELYDHRVQLFIMLCWFIHNSIKPNWEYDGWYDKDMEPWRAKRHNDGSVWDGWFIMGIGKTKGEQITYHLPVSKWDECDFAETLDTAPEWDGHTPADVLERLKRL